MSGVMQPWYAAAVASDPLPVASAAIAVAAEVATNPVARSVASPMVTGRDRARAAAPMC
jgi:hypothetical protein